MKSRPLSKVRYHASTADSGKGVLPQDVHGNVFPVAVDTEHKATALHFLSLGRPHMLTLYIYIFAFFTTYMSSFTVSSLTPLIRENLEVNGSQFQYSGLIGQVGSVIFRIVAGVACDVIGPRYTMACLLLLTVPAVAGMSLVQSYSGLCALRFLIGCQTSTFVVSQYITTSFFSTSIVGLANAISGGWGTAGSGFTQILMPRIVVSISGYEPPFRAWRLAFFIPACLNILGAYLVLRYTVDHPDGNYKDLYAAKQRLRENLVHVLMFGALNYRTWVLSLAYGFSLGSAVTLMDSAVGPYLASFFGVSALDSVSIGGSVGITCFVFRPLGGWVSDRLGYYVGMRGRIWNLWCSQTLAGVLAIVLSRLSNSYDSTLACYLFMGASFFYAQGANMGIAPFVSPRCQGAIIGLVGAGGTAGAAIINKLYYEKGTIPLDQAYQKTGTLIIWVSLVILSLYWPMYGGAFIDRFGTTTEEEYFFADYTIPEVRRGLANRMVLFAAEARSGRGRVRAELYERNIRDGRTKERAARRSESSVSSDDDDHESDNSPPNYSELPKAGITVTSDNEGSNSPDTKANSFLTPDQRRSKSLRSSGLPSQRSLALPSQHQSSLYASQSHLDSRAPPVNPTPSALRLSVKPVFSATSDHPSDVADSDVGASTLIGTKPPSHPAALPSHDPKPPTHHGAMALLKNAKSFENQR